MLAVLQDADSLKTMTMFDAAMQPGIYYDISNEDFAGYGQINSFRDSPSSST